MADYLVLAISCILINNILLAQYLGNCPFLGTSKKMETAIGMAMAVIFVLVLAGAITWMVDTYVLKKFGLEYLRTIVFILVIAALVQFVEMFLKKSIPALYAGLGIFLPLITTNCAVLGVCLININEEYNFSRPWSPLLPTRPASAWRWFSLPASGNGSCWPAFRGRCRTPRSGHGGILSLAFFAFKAG